MIWSSSSDRIALLELHRTGRLPRRRDQAGAFNWLARLDWTRTSTRAEEILLDVRHGDAVLALLDRCWPEWRDVDAALGAAGFPPTPKGLAALRDSERASSLGVLPARMNMRTAIAAVAPHSKASLTSTRLGNLGDAEITRDGSVRLRPPPGIVLRRGAHALDASLVADVLGEVAVAERAFLDGLRIQGPITAVLTVENLGAFQDLTAPDGWLVAHVAGWDTATVGHLLRLLADRPAVHFGDLDPNGVRIWRHLRQIRPDLAWAVPEFWEEFIGARAQRAPWPDDLDLLDAPPLVARLAREGLWLEQELAAVDERMSSALEAMLSDPMPL